MIKELTMLVVSRSGIIRLNESADMVKAKPVGSPKIIRAYLGDNGETKKVIKKHAPKSANAYAMGDHSPTHLDIHPIQYYQIKSLPSENDQRLAEQADLAGIAGGWGD